MANLDYLSNVQQEVASVQELASKNAEERLELLRNGKQEYLDHLESLQDKTLAQGLADVEAVEGLSTNNYAMLSVGEGVTSPAENARAATNAVLSMAAGKYKETTRLDFHEAWFDPSRNAEGVVTALINGKWTIWDWNTQAMNFVPSKRVRPAAKGTEWKDMTKGQRRYVRQVRKHTELNNLLEAKALGHCYGIVYNFKADKEHYYKKIKNRMESSLPDVWEMIAADAQEAETKQYMNDDPNGDGSTPDVIDQAKLDFISEVKKLRSPYKVYYETPAAKNLSRIVDFGDAEAKAKFIKKIENSKSYVTFVKFEKYVEPETA